MVTLQTVVLVGGGMAGVHAAETLRSEGYDGRLLLVCAEPHRPYDRPPLSKMVTRPELSAASCALRPPEWYEEQRIELRLATEARELDTARRSVTLDSGERVSYHRLLLATGARPRWAGDLGERGGRTLTLRTVDDALAIRRRLVAGQSLLVVGGGFIGAELASTARSAGCEVIMLETASAPFERTLGRRVGSMFACWYAGRGIQLVTGAQVCGVHEDAQAARVTTSDGRSWTADVVVIGIGATPNMELAAAAGLAVGDGVEVDARCATSAPDVYAAGDVARRPEPVLGGRIRVEHWQNAQNQGRVAARAMLGLPAGFDEVPWFWSDQFGANLQVAGFPERGDRVVVRGGLDDARLTAYYIAGSALVGVLGVNAAGDVHTGRRSIAERAQVDTDRLAAGVPLRDFVTAPRKQGDIS
jgi:3-phenylpropionate/trans-cinnamate dioxygenase ferredoxin reductase subunit